VEYGSDKEFCVQIKNGWENFDRYYSKTDDSPLYAAALILHPARRTKYVQANWKKKWQRVACQKVEKLWEEYREKNSLPTITPAYEKTASQNLDDVDRIAQDLGKFARPVSQNEYEDYNTESPYEIRTTALKWWLLLKGIDGVILSMEQSGD
ncbi:MAG: hypothetical protein MMC33_010776, partial [Icmadophila ericetorum]|nr:hypothetical protein [Icmadophila ericetorum]